MFIPYDELEQLDCDILQDKTQLIVCMITSLNKELIMNLIHNQTSNHGKYIKLNEFGYATTYFFVSIDNLLGR